MDNPSKPPTAKKRKRKSKTTITTSDPKNLKLESPDTADTIRTVSPSKFVANSEDLIAKYAEKYPILKNQDLVNKFLKVPMSNNQKGRIRQTIRDSLQGTSSTVMPEIIHNKILSILKSSENLTDSELRRIRILYNLLKTTISGEKDPNEKKKGKHKRRQDGDSPKVKDGDSPKVKDGDRAKVKDGDSPKVKNGDAVKEKKDKKELQKVKGPKRYVVFLGNLPLDINKEKILNHFSEMNEHIVDIRIPKNDGRIPKKSAIAYLELSNEPSYEFALSKHHSMLGNKRIKVLYTAPKKGKVTKAGAKSKSAKLIALQKSGKLVGSVPLAKKRSQRRLKMKKAKAKLHEENK